MRESSLRRYFLRKMRGAGAIVYKLSPVNKRGKPDDLVLAPRGRSAIVELKQRGEEPEPHQLREHRRLFRRGHIVEVIDTKAGVDALAKALRA